MEDNHFTFLGYREYRLRRGPRADRLVPVPRSGLGIMRPRAGRKPKPIVLTGEMRAFARSTEPLIITKANSVATVHRSTYLDYVGIKTFDANGRVTGERSASSACGPRRPTARAPHEIPVLRHKVQRVIDHFRLNPSSHDHKALVHALETFPRDELFQATIPDLVRMVRGIVNLYERAQVRLFVRRDPFRRFYSCLVYVPRDRYNTQARERIEKLALEAFGGVAIESQVTLSESVLARLHMLVRTPTGAEYGADAVELERRITETVRTWQDQLKDALLDVHGEAEALRLNRVWSDAFPAAYQEDTPFDVAVDDIDSLETRRRPPWRPAHGPVPARRPAAAQGAVQAAAQGPSDPDLRRAAHDREPRPQADQRAAVRSRNRDGLLLDPGLRARAPPRRQHRPGERRPPLQATFAKVWTRRG